jgi:hypothetical protein
MWIAAALAMGGVSAVGWLWTTPEVQATPGWLDWVAGTAGGIGAAVLGLFLFVPLATGIATLFVDRVAEAVERRHGGHAVLRWCASNVAIAADPAGNIKPVKPDRRKSAARIDGIVALVEAVGCAMATIDGGPSVYETRGLVNV